MCLLACADPSDGLRLPPSQLSSFVPAIAPDPEVYAVLATVPLPGAVVEQPDGYVAYGAVPPTAPPAFQPPSVGRV